MAKALAKNTVITLSGMSGPASGSHDISAYCDTSKFGFGADNIDLTTYGNNSHVWGKALKNATFTCGGKYDSSISQGPWWIMLQANEQTNPITIVVKPQGATTGTESHSFSAVLTDYSQTAAVADYIVWEASFNVSGDITTTIQ